MSLAAVSEADERGGLSADDVPEIVGKGGLFFVMVAIFVAMLLSALDQTIFSTALPTIVGDLNGVSLMLWVTTAFILATTLTMPLYGKLGDLIGHKPLLMSSLVLFLGGSLLGGLAPSMAILITARGIQGLGAGGLMILSQSIIADIAPPRRRALYMGVLGVAWSVSSVLGPILGGWFADTLGWRWAFWFNLPLGTLAAILAAVFLKKPAQRRGRTRFDSWGMTAIAVCTTAIILATAWGGNEYAWDSAVVVGLIAGAVVAGILLVLMERRATEPIIPLHLLRDRNFVLVTIAAFVGSLAFIGILAYVPTYLQMSTGLSPTKSGLLLVPMSIGTFLASLGSGALANRTGRYRWMPITSCALMAVALVLLSAMTTETAVMTICFYLFIFGVGVGLSMQINVLIVQNSFPITEVGTATGAHSFFRQIGSSLGSALVGTLFTSRLTALLAERAASLGTGGLGGVSPNALTPDAVAQMSEQVKAVVVSSYNDALAPVYLYIVPAMIASIVLLFFVKEKPLALTNKLPLDEEVGSR